MWHYFFSKDFKKLKTHIMNSTELKGNWNVIKGKLKQQYADLTDDDLKLEEGKEDELFGRLQKKLGKSKQAILDSIDKKERINF
jgi:uncharacterized protein YjbJ (UPF0337 family)